MDPVTSSKVRINFTPIFGVFAFATFVVSSAFLLFQVLSIYYFPETEPKKEISHAVLGTKSIQCLDESMILSKLVESAPLIKVTAGGQTQQVSTEKFFSCVTISAGKSVNNQCPEIQTGINSSCVTEFVKDNLRFLEEKDVITGTGGKSVYAFKSDWSVDKPALEKMIASEVLARLSDIVLYSDKEIFSKNIILQAPVIQNRPSTDGKAAPKYIEIDGSRQLMFLWTDGNYEMLHVSGALEGYNPVGVFTILNKSSLAWSSTARKWMPYWQAFTFDKKQDAMLGIHGLVYWYPGFTETGTKPIYESELHVGIPRSTGCIRLKKEDAKYVYNWSQVGDLVVIHQ